VCKEEKGEGDEKEINEGKKEGGERVCVRVRVGAKKIRGCAHGH
jgi:hypothetical protein